MGLRWHSDPVRSARARVAARLLPTLIASAGTLVVLRNVFPVDGGSSFMLIVLFWIGVAVAGLSTRLGAPIVHLDAADPAARKTDEETGLGNQIHLREALEREVARYRRYGRWGSLVVIEPRVIGFLSSGEGDEPPSPARYVARALRTTRRDSDELFRLDAHRFVALLADCSQEGIRRFCDRLDEQLGREPYARNPTGGAVMVRAVLGVAPWLEEIDSPATYLEMALTDLERARLAHNSARSGLRRVGA